MNEQDLQKDAVAADRADEEEMRASDPPTPTPSPTLSVTGGAGPATPPGGAGPATPPGGAGLALFAVLAIAALLALAALSMRKPSPAAAPIAAEAPAQTPATAQTPSAASPPTSGITFEIGAAGADAPPTDNAPAPPAAEGIAVERPAAGLHESPAASMEKIFNSTPDIAKNELDALKPDASRATINELPPAPHVMEGGSNSLQDAAKEAAKKLKPAKGAGEITDPDPSAPDPAPQE